MSFSQRLGNIVYYLVWPALFVYLRVGARTRVAVLAEGHMLLVKGWMDDDRWGLPGGGLHRHEDLAVGAAREVAEETGIVLKPGKCEYVLSEWRGRNGLRFYCHFFKAESDSLITPVRQRHEIVAAEWFSLEHIAATRHKKEVDRMLELLAHSR